MDLGFPAGPALAKPISLASRGVRVLLLMGPKVFGSSLIAGVESGFFFGKTTLTELYVSLRMEMRQ